MKERERERGIRIRIRVRVRIQMIYSFRPLPLINGCGWMTYHLTVHTIIVPIERQADRERERERDITVSEIPVSVAFPNLPQLIIITRFVVSQKLDRKFLIIALSHQHSEGEGRVLLSVKLQAGRFTHTFRSDLMLSKYFDSFYNSPLHYYYHVKRLSVQFM